MVRTTHQHQLNPELLETIAPVVPLTSEHQNGSGPISPEIYAIQIVHRHISSDYPNEHSREMARLSTVAVLSGVIEGNPHENFERITQQIEQSLQHDETVAAIGETALEPIIEPADRQVG
jgi:hypothetical protein